MHARPSLKALDVVSRARRLTNLGELERAECVLASRGCAPGAETSARIALAWLRWWQGRFEEARALARHLSAGRDADRLRFLLAWAVGDVTSLERANEAIRRAARRDGWCEAAGLLVASATNRTRVHVRARSHACHIRAGPRGLAAPGRQELDPLAVAVTAEVLTEHGCGAEAVRLLQHVQRKTALTGVEQLLFARIAAPTAEESRADCDPVARQIQRTGARGLHRWGMGRRGMYLMHVLPALLQLVQEAEDEYAALTGVCHWARREGGVEACGVLDSQGRWLATVGWREARIAESTIIDAARNGLHQVTAAGTDVIVLSPVRHGGVSIGSVVVRGRSGLTTTCDEVAQTLAALCGSLVRARLDALSRTGDCDRLTPEILGRSPVMAALRAGVAQAAGTPFPVLIEGPSGTGKELVARAVHRLSARRDRRFCAVNCAALTDELVESELFGYARGAFTGAAGPRAGLFEEANHSTLFLDEVSELSPRAQAMLLRALQEREIRRLGENTPRPVDVRVVAATNLPLVDAVARGRFREDLLFRLAVVRVRVPPLRDRIEDVPLLADAFWRQMSVVAGKRAVLGVDAVTALARHDWPGNVRELQNVVAGLAVVAPARGRVGARHVHLVLAETTMGEPGQLQAVKRQSEHGAIAAALARHGGRRSAAARDLGLSRQGLSKAIKRLGLDATTDFEGVA